MDEFQILEQELENWEQENVIAWLACVCVKTAMKVVFFWSHKISWAHFAEGYVQVIVL